MEVECDLQTRSSFVIGIGGGTGSGKTAIAESLVRELGSENAMFLSLDSYYQDRSKINFQGSGPINYDHPGAIDFGALTKDLRQLAHGKPVVVPIYDFITHSRTSSIRVLPKPIIIVEGLFALTNSALRRECDLKIFVDVPAEIRLARKLQRDVDMRGEEASGIINHFLQDCRPMHLKHVEPTKSYADLTISNETQISDAVEQVKHVIMRARGFF